MNTELRQVAAYEKNSRPNTDKSGEKNNNCTNLLNTIAPSSKVMKTTDNDPRICLIHPCHFYKLTLGFDTVKEF